MPHSREAALLREMAESKGGAVEMYLKCFVMPESKAALIKDDGIMFQCHMSHLEGAPTKLRTVCVPK